MTEMTTERQQIVAGSMAGVAIAFLLFIAPLPNSLKLGLMAPTVILTGRHTRKHQVTQDEVNHVLFTGLNATLDEAKVTLNRGYQVIKPNPGALINRPVPTGSKVAIEMIKPHLPQFQAEVNRKALYRKVISEKFLVITGRQREGKTMLAHQLLYEFVDKHPNSLVLIHDADYGVTENPAFTPDWTNLPAFEAAPTLKDKDVQSQVVTGDDEFAAIVGMGFSLFEQRRKTKTNPFPLLLIFDDVTTRLGDLESDERKIVQAQLRKVAARGKKYGIHVWLLIHSVATNESGIGTSLFDNSCLIAGVQMTRNNYVKQRFDVADDTWRLGWEKNQVNERGFITTHSDIPGGYLPAPNFRSTKELHLPWAEAPNSIGALKAERVKTFEARIALDAVQYEVEKHRAKQSTFRQLFFVVWQKKRNGTHVLETQILKDYLTALNVVNEIDPPVEDAFLKMKLLKEYMDSTSPEGSRSLDVPYDDEEDEEDEED